MKVHLRSDAEGNLSGRAQSVLAIARREGVTPRYVSRVLELAFLPPRLVEAILAGVQPADMTAETLTRTGRGLVWSADCVATASSEIHPQQTVSLSPHYAQLKLHR